MTGAGDRDVSTPYVEGALVSGSAAHVLDRILRAPNVLRVLENLPAPMRAEVLAARRAIARAATAYEVLPLMSADGPADIDSADIGPISPHEISVETAAVMLGVSARHARRLAAGGMGRQVGRTWLLDRSQVVAYRERRRSA